MRDVTIEEIERNDWEIDSKTPISEKKQKSISAYYLPRWIEDMKKFTFHTEVVPVNKLDSFIPKKSVNYMVKWEHKSPKDSPHWGPINGSDPNFHQKISQMFYTSLRCRGSPIPGKYFCFREFVPLQKIEYRCFWNRRLVAVGAETHEEGSFDQILSQEIIAFVDKISPHFPYYRCVFDIAKKEGMDGESGEFIFIEFNSWESNSGAYPFDWIDDTDILYPEKGNEIHFRWNKENLIVNHGPLSNMNFIPKIILSTDRGDYAVTDIYLYWISSQTSAEFLTKFKNGEIKSKKRGVYRFCKIIEKGNNILIIEDKSIIKLNYDLSNAR